MVNVVTWFGIFFFLFNVWANPVFVRVCPIHASPFIPFIVASHLELYNAIIFLYYKGCGSLWVEHK
jgi:hypothetical protein